MLKLSLYKTVLIIISFCLTMASMADEAIDFEVVATKINQLMQQYHYNPDELKQPAYLLMEKQVADIGKKSNSVDDFINQFNSAWNNGPFSHVRLQKAPQTATALAEYLDNMRVGEEASTLEINSDYAVMTINTMMGVDTIERITGFYQQLADSKINNLIIDLRNNNGGAFAVKPLVGHLLIKPIDVGVFVSQPWNANYKSAPSLAQTQKKEPWMGWSIRSFWADVQKNDLTRIQMMPEAPLYKGNVYVLTSGKTASAAELATDALGYLDNVTVIGETTEGAMLSQSIFDVAEGLQLFLPIADYYSHRSGRIEGNGVKPDINTMSSNALDKALSLISDS